MARSIRVRGKQHLPGGGFNSNGNPRQGKIQVWGKIEVTDYRHGGETLTPADLGLRTIEWLDIKFDNAVGGASGGNYREAKYSYVDQQFYLLESQGGVAVGPLREIANTADPRLSFLAAGDTIDDVELI